MNLLESTRTYLLTMFMGLPLILVGFVLFIAVGQGNIGLLMLGLGEATVVPAASSLLNFVLMKLMGPENSLIRVSSSDVCQLIPSQPSQEPQVGVAPSAWVAVVSFFFSQLLWNITSVLNMAPEMNAETWKVNNRKARATMALAMTCFAFFFLLVMRKTLTGGCETWFGMSIGVASMMGLAQGWQLLAQVCGARHADVFGIVQMMIPASATAPPPVTCVQNPKGV